MSSIRKELNELAIKIGAPIVGANISEQIRAINTHLGGTSHGANISERIDEFAKVYSTGSSGSSIITERINAAYGMTGKITIMED